MSADAWITVAVVVAMVVALTRDLLAPTVTVVGAMITLLVLDVVPAELALAGFSNPAPITVGALYVVAAGVEKTGLMGPLVNNLLGDRPGRRALGRLTTTTAAGSAFLNNTPIVAMVLPTVQGWASRFGDSASRYLMPLSFATILGGVVTTIGTSTNLVVSGLLQRRGDDGFDIFEITPVGLPVAIVGLITVVLLAPRALPDRVGVRKRFSEEARQFVVQMVVEHDGPLDGKAVEEGGLRHLEGVFLVEIVRDGERIAPVAPSTVLRGGDELMFVGQSDLVVDLQRERGLRSTEQPHLLAVDSPHHTFFEAVIGTESPLVGQTLAEIGFRARYQAAVVGIHRAGEALRAKFGQVRLRPGDTLLLLAGPDFRAQWRNRQDFLLVARQGGTPPSATRKAPVAAAVLLAVVVVSATGTLDILKAALLGAVALVVLGVLTPSEARDSVDLNVVILIAAAFGVGAAIEVSGLAEEVAGGLVDLFGGFGDIGVLAGIVVATVILTELITNNAAAVLMFPIGITAGAEAGYEPRAVAIAIAVAASASFLTPIGYQTNTMVYGPGGYRFGDYVRLGAPLTLTVIATILLVVPAL